MMKTEREKAFLPKVSLFSEGEEKRPEAEKDPAIVIRPVEGRKGEYLACCRSEFLGATFSCLLKDTLMGALALHAFSEMVRKRYEEDNIRIVVSGKETDFRSKALLDLMSPGKEIEDRQAV